MAVGAVPVLVDVDESLTIDPEDIKRKITPYTKAIMPVHMLNLVCDMDAITAIAKEHRLKVIEDACQAVGVTYKGRRVGTIGEVGAFSFNQFKNLNSGEGGAVLTNDDRIFTRARMFHDVGSYTREYAFESNEAVFCRHEPAGLRADRRGAVRPAAEARSVAAASAQAAHHDDQLSVADKEASHLAAQRSGECSRPDCHFRSPG